MTAPVGPTTRVLFPGEGSGMLLRLAAPLSFWGGIDPASGRIIAPAHPDHGRSVAGQVLAMAATIGSSSSSSVLLELIRIGRAPAAILLGEVDAILLVGCLVGREMGYRCPPMLALQVAAVETLAAGTYRVTLEGALLGP